MCNLYKENDTLEYCGRNRRFQIAIYANCQSKALINTLIENTIIKNEYNFLPIKPVQLLKVADIADVIHKASIADIFIYQPIKKTDHRPMELTSKFLIEKLKKKAIPISFPSIYFDGYFPHLSTLNGEKSVLNLVHDYIIAHAFQLGLSLENTFRLIQSSTLYPKQLSTQLYSDSINNLIARETAENIDITVSSFIKQNYKKFRLFNQFNHPTSKIFTYVTREIFKIIGITQDEKNENKNEYLDSIKTPIYRSTYLNLSLEFKEDFLTYNSTLGKKINQRYIIKQFFDFYSKIDQIQLRDIISKKTFIHEIVNEECKKLNIPTSIANHSRL